MIDSTVGAVVFEGLWAAGSKSAVLKASPTKGASMDADLDLLLIAVYVTADDLLPRRPMNARRSVTDAEVVTLCVAQGDHGYPF